MHVKADEVKVNTALSIIQKSISATFIYPIFQLQHFVYNPHFKQYNTHFKVWIIHVHFKDCIAHFAV